MLLCEHNEEGSFGFVLNNFVDIDVDEVMDDLPKLNTRISVGGPVKNGNLYYLHTGQDITDSIPVVDGVHMGGDFEQIQNMLKEGGLKSHEIDFSSGTAGGPQRNFRKRFEADLGSLPMPRNRHHEN